MARKKDPAADAVAFFETAPIEIAQAVLAICQGVVARRSPAKAARSRTAKKPVTAPATTTEEG